MRLLLVEDEQADADLIVEYLSRAKNLSTQLEITRAQRIATALECLRSESIDVILLDLSLPDSQGVATLHAIQQCQPDIPVVVLTGARARLASHVIEAGAQDYLPKRSLGTDVLVRTLTHAVERARLQTQMRHIVERTSDALVIVDGDDQVLFANTAASTLFSAKDLTAGRFPYPYKRDGSSEILVPGKREGARRAEINAAELRWQGVDAVLLSIRDITDRERAADLQKRLLHADRLASIGQLAAGVAHEINNPAQYVSVNLTCLKSEFDKLGILLKRISRTPVETAAGRTQLAQLLRGAKLATRLSDIAEMLDDNMMGMDRIVSIVKDLRTFARIERDAVELLDVNEVLEVACSMTLNEIKHRAKLVKDFSRMPYVAADRGKLAQVFTNLLLNAAQAIEEGAADSHRIRVETRATDEHVIIAISDTGSGISTAALEHIFEPFFTTKPREVGTGLGLALSAEIVRKHDGTLTVTSELGKGSTFTIKLPRDSDLARDCGPASGVTPSQRIKSGRVLVVDDELPLLQAYKRMLAREHTVVTALGGRAALELLHHDADFDAIVCDLMMPDVDGVAVYQALKTSMPQLLPKIVYCTGGAFTQRVRDFTERIRNLCLDKPVSWDLLRRVVNDLCSRQPHPPYSSIPPDSKTAMGEG